MKAITELPVLDDAPRGGNRGFSRASNGSGRGGGGGNFNGNRNSERSSKTFRYLSIFVFCFFV